MQSIGVVDSILDKYILTNVAQQQWEKEVCHKFKKKYVTKWA